MGIPASSIGMGECFGFPDVCKTPTPAGPVPIPYPNVAMLADTLLPTAAETVFIVGKNAVVETTEIMMSEGDEAGALGGVISELVSGPAQFKLGSTRVFLEGRGAAYLGSIVGQNGSADSNDPVGTQIVPSQETVLVSP